MNSRGDVVNISFNESLREWRGYGVAKNCSWWNKHREMRMGERNRGYNCV
jgi:hypothetical protein